MSNLIYHSNGDVLAQRKFVQSVSLPKKRGRKRKEPNNILVCEKAYTEDFINFLCVRRESACSLMSLKCVLNDLSNDVCDT